MAIYSDNPLNENTLQYSGIAIFVFAIIYYLIQKNSYCNEKSALCKNPILVNSELEPNKIIINKSNASIVQHIKCEPLPLLDTTTYSTMTNKSISLYAFILIIIFGLILLIIYSKSTVFNDVIFNTISSDKRGKVSLIILLMIIITIIITVTNYLTRGYESESIISLIVIFIIVSIVFIAFIDKSKVTPNIELQRKILFIIVIAIAFITLQNLRYIYNLQVGHALISSGSLVTLIVQLITIVLMGIALIDNYNLLDTNFNAYIIYVIIFITLLIQTSLFGSHIYHCIWKTYDCEPDISITKESNDMTKIKVNCSANLSLDNSIGLFILLAVLFIILPSNMAINYITNGVQSILDAINYLLNAINNIVFE